MPMTQWFWNSTSTGLGPAALALGRNSSISISSSSSRNSAAAALGPHNTQAQACRTGAHCHGADEEAASTAVLWRVPPTRLHVNAAHGMALCCPGRCSRSCNMHQAAPMQLPATQQWHKVASRQLPGMQQWHRAAYRQRLALQQWRRVAFRQLHLPATQPWHRVAFRQLPAMQQCDRVAFRYLSGRWLTAVIRGTGHNRTLMLISTEEVQLCGTGLLRCPP